jgi:hypothetical protein
MLLREVTVQLLEILLSRVPFASLAAARAAHKPAGSKRLELEPAASGLAGAGCGEEET